MGMAICGNLAGHEDKFYNNKVVQLTNRSYAQYDCTCADPKQGHVNTCPQIHDNSVYTPDGTSGDVCGMNIAARQVRGHR